MQLMLIQEPLECSSFLAGGFGGMGDIAVMQREQIDEIGPFKLLDGRHFSLTQSARRLLIIDGSCQFNMMRLDCGSTAMEDGALQDAFKLTNIAGPAMREQLADRGF